MDTGNVKTFILGTWTLTYTHLSLEDRRKISTTDLWRAHPTRHELPLPLLTASSAPLVLLLKAGSMPRAQPASAELSLCWDCPVQKGWKMLLGQTSWIGQRMLKTREERTSIASHTWENLVFWRKSPKQMTLGDRNVVCKAPGCWSSAWRAPTHQASQPASLPAWMSGCQSLHPRLPGK